MELRRGTVVLAAALLGVGGLAPLTAASADEPVTDLYVSTASSCRATGPGTQTSPFCTVQQAADVVLPGQTVHVGRGTYYGPLTLTRSGTPDAPITFVGAPGTDPTELGVFLELLPGSTGANLTFSGVHDVNVTKVLVSSIVANDGVDVVGSSRIGFTGSRIGRGYSTMPADSSASFHVDGTSSDVSFTENFTVDSPGYSVRVDAGAQRVTVAGNALTDDLSGAVTATGTTGLALTGNTVEEPLCVPGLTLDGTTTATVENNVLETAKQSGTAPCTEGAPLIDVSASAAATVHTDYNGLFTGAPRAPYTWAGTDYASAAGLAAAVPGQAAHDADVDDVAVTPGAPENAPLVDSADANAPGVIDQDYFGNPRFADDPSVPNTGTGPGTLDRGYGERQSKLTVLPSYTPAGTACAAPCDVTVDVTPQDSWNEPVTTEVDFGDGSPAQPVTDGSAAHRYTVPGRYTATTTATNADGYQVSATRQVTVATTEPPALTLTAEAAASTMSGYPSYETGTIHLAYTAGADEWEIADRSFDFGDGSAPTTPPEGFDTALHGYSSPGTYTATLTTTDVLGRTSIATITYTVGEAIVPQAPQRVYDTRSSGHQAIPAHGTLTLSRSQFAGATSSAVHGVYLTATVTGASAGGYLSVYPGGTARPTSSVLNFPAQHNVANTVLAPLGSEGKVVFYNGSGQSIDLVLDQCGIEVGANTGGYRPGDTYSPVGPTRILDTRNGTGAPDKAVAGKADLVFTAAGTGGVPSDADAVVLNVAATDTKAGGHLTVYGHGTSYPGTSNSNWSAGQTVSNLVVVPMTDGKAVLNNGSTASADFVADVVGYYHHYGRASVVVPMTSQVRVLDTRTGAGTGGQVAEIPAHGTVKLVLAGADGVPSSGVTAADLNLTATHETGSGYITAYPDGTTRPNASSVNFHAGQSVANAAVVPVGADGAIDLYNGGSTPVDLVADLAGYYYAYPDAA